MTQKNRLRSIVVRKRFAPLLGDLALAINTVQTAMEKPRHLNLRRLKRWEEEVMGFTYLEDKNPHRRLERLIVALEAMRHYATIATNASATDKARWARQTDDARRIKLISLILSDLTLMDEDHAAEPGERQWLIWDGLLTKCEILVFGEFIYRGLKAFEVAMHQPFTVREFMEQHPQASRRELIRLINDHLHHVISQPLMRASKNSVSEVTNAVLESTALV